MLELKELYKSFGNGQEILRGVSLQVKSGCAVCIAGKNASGKTTLLRIACGIIKADSGVIFCRGHVAFVPQEPAILPDLSVKENLKLWYAAQGKNGPDFSADSLESKFGLKDYKRKKAGDLSGGMKKRLSIACALVKMPHYLLLDEPFASLDAPSCRQLASLLNALKSAGVGILFTSHEPAHISAVADELLLLRDGALVKTDELSAFSGKELSAHVLSLLYSQNTLG